MSDLAPLWKTGTPAQAVEILRAGRASTDELIAVLAPKQLTTPSVLGDGTWSIKDLLGHIAICEERALALAGARPSPDPHPFASVDEQNDFHIEQRRRWSLAKMQRHYAEVRDALVEEISGMDDARWLTKVDTGKVRSALGLVLGKMLNGGRFGFFAHDLAHRADLQRAVTQLKG
jgi:uncharacterized protein (TIGR03083 family)